jgi:gamma-glutamyl-gamma-aminobutyrate hydrolase PuuD
MRCIAVSDPSQAGHVIEAIEAADQRRYYLGVQWHPERTEDPMLGTGLFKALISRTMKKQ